MSGGFHRGFARALRAGTALAGIAAAGMTAQQSAAVTVNDAYTPTQIVDTNNITGVGQMVVDQQNGYVGLCTASLINPRTVIFASHCVNENSDETDFRPGTAYGAAFGGIPIGFGFQSYTRPSIVNWLRGGYETSVTDQFYNSNYVVYNTNSTALGVQENFLQSDIAMAALDMPATDVPQWTLLFSPLTSATHTTIEGYGNNGDGTNGDYGGIDFRRRVAENTISVLGSLDDQDLAIFGPPPDGLPQNLYMMDFNDPLYGTAQANEYDFNIFHDAALTKEGITAPGDSGGPLVVDQLFSESVIAAVLSGGDRFFYGQPGSSYGTTSFYQPLYLFWDWIVANNPYKYVSAKPGNGDWFDPNHWVMNLDPNYLTVVNGQLVNALPTTPAQGTPQEGDVNTPKFGEVCIYDSCTDIAGGSNNNSVQASGDALSGGPAEVTLESLLGSLEPSTSASSSSALARYRAGFISRGYTWHPAGTTNAVEGSATIGGEVVQGAPGSSNFVPDDDDGDPTVDRPARYYDVTLSATGTTTLDNYLAVIDRLTINGANTGLTIGSQGALGTLIDTTMFAGNFRVDGLYISFGDVALMGGVLNGSGSVVAPYTTAVLGAIAPGPLGSPGTLSIFGDVVFSSGSGLLIAMGQNQNSLLEVFGELSLGGTAVFSPVGGFTPVYHSAYVFAEADTVSGAFAHVPDTIPGVLYPVVHQVTVASEGSTYFQEVVSFEAASFGSQLPDANDDQLQVGGALDGGRSTNYSAMQSLYNAIDPLADGALGQGLSNLVPDNGRAAPVVGELLVQSYTSLIWQHLGEMGVAGQNGNVALNLQTSALQMAGNSPGASLQTRSVLGSLGSLDRGPIAAPIPAEASSAGGMSLPKGMGGFLAGSVIDGAVAVGGSGGKAGVDGFVIGAGLDLPVREDLRLGLSLTFSQASASLRNTPQRANANSFGGLVYADYSNADGWFANAFAGDTGQAIQLTRDVVVGATTYHLVAHTGGTTPVLGLQAGRFIDYAGIRFAPAIGFQWQRSHVAEYTETGGPAAMHVNPYGVEEFDLRAGFDAYGSVDFGDVTILPNLHVFLADNVAGAADPMVTSFAAAPGALMSFAMGPTGSNHAWAELGIGTDVECGHGATFGVHYNAAVGRPDSRYGAWTGKLRIAF
jgi:hypothetical protein